MQSLFTNGLKLVQGEIKVESVKEGFSIELNGQFVMKRGEFQQKIGWYGRMYISNYGENIIGVDEWEILHVSDVKLGELPINDIRDFKTLLENGGLKTLSDSLGFSSDDEKQAIFNAIKNHKDFKKAFGKKAILWNALSVDEQKLYELKFVCAKYDTCSQHLKKEVGKHYGIDTEVDPNDANNYITIIPSLEVFQAKLLELTK